MLFLRILKASFLGQDKLLVFADHGGQSRTVHCSPIVFRMLNILCPRDMCGCSFFWHVKSLFQRCCVFTSTANQSLRALLLHTKRVIFGCRLFVAWPGQRPVVANILFRGVVCVWRDTCVFCPAVWLMYRE